MCISSLKGILMVIEFHLILDFYLYLVFEYPLAPPVSQSTHLMRSPDSTSICAVGTVVFVSA